MTQVRFLGPTLILAITVVAIVVGGPTVMRHLAWAEQDARIQQGHKRLKQAQALENINKAFRYVAESVRPSVVQITAKKGTRNEETRRFRGFNRFELPEIGSGSGWVYNDGKHVITNNHVVKEADSIVVKFQDNTTADAILVGADPRTDIAVLRLTKGPKLHASKLADKSVLQGDVVFAFGSPFKFDFSMSQGIVSATGRQLNILGSTGYENFIQTDAAINPGNSGGPLTNIYGEVVGMNTAIATRTNSYNGIGFAIPIDMIQNVADQLIKTGKVQRGWLGVSIADVNPAIAEELDYDGKGVVIAAMIDGLSPAEDAGLERFDIIVEINNKPVKNTNALRRIVAKMGPGSEIAIKFFRKGKFLTKKVKLTEQPKNLDRIR